MFAVDVATYRRRNQRCVTSSYGTHDQLNADGILYGERHCLLGYDVHAEQRGSRSKKIDGKDGYCLLGYFTRFAVNASPLTLIGILV